MDGTLQIMSAMIFYMALVIVIGVVFAKPVKSVLLGTAR